MSGKHSQEWYKKVRNRDNKNIKILMGQSTKKPASKYFSYNLPNKLGKSAPPLVATLISEQEQKILDKPIKSSEQVGQIVDKIGNKYMPNAGTDDISKLTQFVSQQPNIDTVGKLLMFLLFFIQKFGDRLGGMDFVTGGSEEVDVGSNFQMPDVSPDLAEDLRLPYKKLWDKFGGFDNYIKFLWKQFDDHKDELRGWTKDRVIEQIKESARKYGVPEYIPLGVLVGESGLRPVGIHTQTLSSVGSPATAASKNSTAYGVGQVVSSSYDSIKNMVGVPHYMLWNPKYGIDAAVALLYKLLKRFGRLEPALTSYAGTPEGGQRKLAAVQRAARIYGES